VNLAHGTKLLVLVALAPGAVACTDTTASCDRVGPSPVRALTFNAGLATNFVGYAPERLDKIGPAVAGTQADVVCLQEVWTDAHAAKVAADLLATYPYQHRVVTTDPGAGGPAACSAAEADPLAVCVNANCIGAPSLAECALGNCFAEYSAASDGCKTCLAANIGQNSIDVIFDACAKGSSSLAFDGRNGLLLVSKTPLSDTGHVVLESYLNTRIALHATTTPASGEPLSVVCTHLTAVLPGVSYSGKYADWAAEQAAQIGGFADNSGVDSR
jgi:hypothetical protein